MFEEIETIQILPNNLAEKILKREEDIDSTIFLTGGEKGKLRLWDSKKMSEILPNNDKKNFSITTKGVLLKDKIINEVLIGSDDIIILQDDLFNYCSFSGKKNKLETTCICANQHEALDMIIVEEKYLVVATMSPVIKVYDVKSNKLIVCYC